MTTAADVIRRGLRLINVPGRGALLSSEDSKNALETLASILDRESVTQALNAGIRRHFFAAVAGKAVYSYGPGADLNTTPFGDPVPVRIEDAYLRSGSSVDVEELVADPNFATSASWTFDPGWSIVNNSARIAPGNSDDSIFTPVVVEAREYTIRISITRRAGAVRLALIGSGGTLFQTLSVSGTYEFNYTAGFAEPLSLSLFADSALSDADVTHLSMIPVGLDAVSMVEGVGTDYPICIDDQKTYNRRQSKGIGGRPSHLLFSRSFPWAEVRFDNAPSAGDVLVFDVLVNRLQVPKLTSTVALHPEAMTWLVHRLAFECAPEYGKQLSGSAQGVMREAWGRIAAVNMRPNNLRIDAGLRSSPRFDINRGDT